MSEHFSLEEVCDPAERERQLMARLPAQVEHARARCAYFAETLADVDAGKVDSRAALATLPVVRKHQLLELQKRRPPLGGLAATPLAGLAHVLSSPGPIADPEGRGEDWWR